MAYVVGSSALEYTYETLEGKVKTVSITPSKWKLIMVDQNGNKGTTALSNIGPLTETDIGTPLLEVIDPTTQTSTFVPIKMGKVLLKSFAMILNGKFVEDPDSDEGQIERLALERYALPGSMIYDKTKHLPVWWDGVIWHNALGDEVYKGQFEYKTT